MLFPSGRDRQGLPVEAPLMDTRFSFVDMLGKVVTLEIPPGHDCETASIMLTQRSGIPHKVLTPKDKILWPTSP